MQSIKKWRFILGGILVIAGATALIMQLLRGKEQEKAPAFLPGVYAFAGENEFCRIDDTLTIRRRQAGEDNYAVTRSSGFIRVRNGKRDTPEYSQHQWYAEYQGKKYWIVSTNEKDTILYYPEVNRVSKACFYYEKIE